MSLVDPWKRKALPMEKGTYHRIKNGKAKQFSHLWQGWNQAMGYLTNFFWLPCITMPFVFSSAGVPLI